MNEKQSNQNWPSEDTGTIRISRNHFIPVDAASLEECTMEDISMWLFDLALGGNQKREGVNQDDGEPERKGRCRGCGQEEEEQT